MILVFFLLGLSFFYSQNYLREKSAAVVLLLFIGLVSHLVPIKEEVKYFVDILHFTEGLSLVMTCLLVTGLIVLYIAKFINYEESKLRWEDFFFLLIIMSTSFHYFVFAIAFSFFVEVAYSTRLLEDFLSKPTLLQELIFTSVMFGVYNYKQDYPVSFQAIVLLCVVFRFKKELYSFVVFKTKYGIERMLLVVSLLLLLSHTFLIVLGSLSFVILFFIYLLRLLASEHKQVAGWLSRLNKLSKKFLDFVYFKAHGHFTRHRKKLFEI